MGRVHTVTKEVERQQFLELMRIVASSPDIFSHVNREMAQQEFMMLFDLTTQRQQTLGRLLGRKPDEFIP